MPTDFSNILFNKILEPLALLLNNEFKVPLYYDKHRGSNSFLLSIQSDEFVSQLSYGMQREYNINISYELKVAGNYNKDSIKQISSIMERLKRLINDNPTSSSGGEYFDGKIDSIEYERDEEDASMLKANAIFNCQNIEVF